MRVPLRPRGGLGRSASWRPRSSLDSKHTCLHLRPVVSLLTAVCPRRVFTDKTSARLPTQLSSAPSFLPPPPPTNQAQARSAMTAFTEPGRPSAIDLTHHLSVLSKSRHPSPLKDILKFMVEPGMISFAGGKVDFPSRVCSERKVDTVWAGLPHPGIFPFARLSLDAYPATAPLDPSTPDELPDGLLQISVSKESTKAASSEFSAALQYGASRVFRVRCTTLSMVFFYRERGGSTFSHSVLLRVHQNRASAGIRRLRGAD